MTKRMTYEELESRYRTAKEAEEKLKRAEDRARRLFENVPIPLYRSTPGGRILEANPALLDLLGCPDLETLKHARAEDTAFPEYLREEHEIIDRDGIVLGFEMPLRRFDGTVIWVRDTVRARKDAEGRLLFYEGSIEDVTARRQAEQALQEMHVELEMMVEERTAELMEANLQLGEEKERFRILVDENPLGVALVGKDGRYKYINPKFTEIFGYTLEDIPTGREWFSRAFPDPAYRKEVISFWTRDHAETPAGEAYPRDLNVTCGDGSEKTVRFRSVTMHTGEILVIYTDITERRRLEAQLLRAQRMEATGTLAGGIAHDFNNLLMGMQGNVSLMLLDLDPYHPHCERLKNVERYIRSGADLTRQLLGFARGGKQESKPGDLNEIVRATAAMFGRTRKEITIHEAYHTPSPIVQIDRGQIEQVLLNLYVNAWHAMPGGGNLYIQTEEVVLDSYYVAPYGVETGTYAKISVTDTGVGIDESIMQKVFDPFFTTKEAGRGTGLGLATSYRIIKNHDGVINAYSVKGKGSTFNIYLPVSREAICAKEAQEEDILTGTETVLLVDDEEMITTIGRDLLETLGYRVISACSGAEALEAYEAGKREISLVILDMIMPDMGGGEVFDRLKAQDPEIKVLLSSGYSINGQASAILKRGCRGFIQKPFNLRQLSRRIRETLDRD